MEKDYMYRDVLNKQVWLKKENDKLTEIRTSLFRKPDLVNEYFIMIGLLGDLHGHITLGLEIMKDWQDFTGRKLDMILQVGDIGAFDERTVLDKTTIEMAEKDPDELGFKNYLYKSDEGDRFFGKNGIFEDIPLFYIAGNHDDLDLLNSKKQLCYYENLQYIANGEIVTFSKGDIEINIGGLGHEYQDRHLKNMIVNDLDILLMHYPLPDRDSKFYRDKLELLIDTDRNTYKFFGHIHGGAVETSQFNKRLIGLNEVRLKRNELKKGSIGYLQFSKKDSTFIYLPEEIDMID